MSYPLPPRGITGDTEMLDQMRPPLAPIADHTSRPRPDDREDAAGWRKIDSSQSASSGWMSVDDIPGEGDAGWREVQMVQRLPDPRLVTDGMAGGGIIVERYSMTAPGSDPVDKPSTIFPLTDIASMDQAAHAVIPVGTEKDRYHPGPPAQGTTWQPTATHGASYEGTSYSDQDGRLP